MSVAKKGAKMEECCKNCVHCHKTKEFVNHEWKEYYICTLWLDLKEKSEPLLQTLGDESQVVGKNNLCECIQLKEQK